MTRVCLDTSVIIEYIDRGGKYHQYSSQLFNLIIKGNLRAIIPHVILAETYYVASRIYEKLGLENPDLYANKLVEWLYRLPTIQVIGEPLDLVLEAGKIKLKYRLALTDCYILAVSKLYNCKVIFREREKEMINIIKELEKEFKIMFLEDYI